MHIFASQRTFEVWQWGVGHTGLLLRSIPGKTGEPRIEVIFKPAYFVCLPTWLTSLDIVAQTDDDVIETACQVLGRELGNEENVFGVTCREATGWVVAGTTAGRQGPENGTRDPMFDGWAADGDVIDLFTTYVQPW